MIAISIIVPMYKVEKYIIRCLRSLINQTFSDIEIIVVNDGSPDESEKIALSLAAQDERIKVYSKENGGVSSARNYGMKFCTGKYVMFVDSDDMIHPQMCEVLYQNAEKEKISYVRCGFTSFASNDVDFGFFDMSCIKTERITTDAVREDLMDDTVTWSVWGAIYKRSFLLENHLEFELYKELGEDVPFTLKVLSSLKNYVKVDLPLYYYYSNPNSIMHNVDDSLFSSYEHIMQIMSQYCKEKGNTKILQPLAIRLLSYIIAWNRTPRKSKLSVKYDYFELIKIKQIVQRVSQLDNFHKVLICDTELYNGKYKWLNRFIGMYKKQQFMFAAAFWYYHRCLLKQ